MVQVIENRADVHAHIESVVPHPSLPGYHLVTFVASKIADVPGYPNLFPDATGRPIGLTLQSDRLDELGLGPGDEISARIRLAGPQSVFADPESVAKV